MDGMRRQRRRRLRAVAVVTDVPAPDLEREHRRDATLHQLEIVDGRSGCDSDLSSSIDASAAPRSGASAGSLPAS